MKIILFNGSPRRRGNTVNALNALRQGMQDCHQITWVNAYDQNIMACTHCDACKHNGGRCIQPDDSAAWIDLVNRADMIIFGSPVYWWGISAKAKLALDKFYANDEAYKASPAKKQLGIIAVGEEKLDNPGYRMISEQFHCIAKFLGWTLVVDQSISAAYPGDLAADTATLSKLTAIGRQL